MASAGSPHAASSTTEHFDGKRCSLRVEALPAAPRSVTFSVRCNFLINDLVIEATRPIRNFSRTLRLTNPDPEDRPHTCTKTARKEVTCHGEAGENVTMTGRLRVKGRVCARPRLGIKVTLAQGGDDCDGEGPCIGVGYRAETRRKTPAGC